MNKKYTCLLVFSFSVKIDVKLENEENIHFVENDVNK